MTSTAFSKNARNQEGSGPGMVGRLVVTTVGGPRYYVQLACAGRFARFGPSQLFTGDAALIERARLPLFHATRGPGTRHAGIIFFPRKGARERDGDSRSSTLTLGHERESR